MPARVAILYPGDREIRANATPENNRFASIFRALTARGIRAEPAVYHDDFCDEVRAQLLGASVVLVWMNPIEHGRDRSRLDAMLRDVAAAGVFVSTHPDVILALGTKEIVYRTRDMEWGTDTALYRDIAAMRAELPRRLEHGPRVIKQYRGNGGLGVWKVERVSDSSAVVREATRGAPEETLALGAFVDRCAPYFGRGGLVVDQAYQVRLPEGMIRCYLVHDVVGGFGHQAVNALCPALPGAPPGEFPQPTPRVYLPETTAEFARLKEKLEHRWVPELRRRLGLTRAQLPVLWDADFLLGPTSPDGDDTYVLCEINVSSVAPYPESAVPYIAAAAAEHTGLR